MIEWRQVESLRFYEVSSDGRVRSVDRLKLTSNGQVRFYRGRELKTSRRNQYGHIGGRADGRAYYVHHLVAEAFIGPRPAGMYVCHIDGDALNNSVENLKYATPSENMHDMKRHGNARAGESHPFAKLTRWEVAAIRRAIRSGEGQSAIAERFGVSRSNISAIATRRSWS